MVLDGLPILVPKITALTHGVSPPSLGGGHEILIVRDQHEGGPLRRVTERLDPGVDLRSGDSVFGSRETASSSEDQRRRKHIGEVMHSDAQPQRRSTRSLEKRPPVLSRNKIRQLLLAHSFNVPQELCLTPGSTAYHAASTCILGWDHASGPETRARILLTLDALEQVLVHLLMLSCGTALLTVQDRVGGNNRREPPRT